MSTTTPVVTRPRPLRRRPTSTHSYSYAARYGSHLSTHKEEWGIEIEGNVYASGRTVEVWAQIPPADEPFAQFRVYDGNRVHVFNEWGYARTARGLVLRAHALAKTFARGGW